MHAGAFGAGLVGTFIVWLACVAPRLSIWDNSINALCCAITLCLLPVTYYLYWQLITSDPGYLPLPQRGM